MLGTAAVAMWWDVAPQVQAEWEDWHTREHMPERLSIPGFLRGSRWVAGTSYFVLYELDGAATLTGRAYLERLNNPTPWSRRMMPHHRNMARTLCEVRASAGRGFAGVLAVIQDKVPLQTGKGISAAHLLEGRSLAGTPQTAEQRLRGGDAEAQWISLIGGYDAAAVEAAARALGGEALVGVYRLSYSL
jgi:hypothetical protein